MLAQTAAIMTDAKAPSADPEAGYGAAVKWEE